MAVGLTSTAQAGEAVVDRSAFSTTVKAGDGFKTRTYPEQVNFKGDDGKWAEIDRTLESKSDGTVRPAAIDGDAIIPSTLTKPLVLEHEGRTVSFRLLGADAGADRDVSGTKASFDDALAGVDVAYKVRPTGLKETLTLASAKARRSFSYDVRADSDLSAAIADGDLVLKDATGTERFRVAAPLAWDSAKLAQTTNALTLSVVKTGDRQWRLTMRADDKWLDDPARVYPVTLDPDYFWIDGKLRFHGANQDCALAGGNQATLNQCAYQNLQIGYGNSRPYKSVMKFDVASAIPTYARVTAARFLAWQFPSTQKFEVSSRLRTVTSDWDNNSTWNNRKANTPWTTAGGDVSTNAALTGDPITVGPSGYWSYWPAPVAAVSGWIKGTLPNYGFQVSTDLTTPTVKSAYEFTSTDGVQQNWPALEVTWVPDTIPPVVAKPGAGPAVGNQDYLGGTAIGTVSATATDDSSGIRQLDLIRDGVQAAASGIACPSNTCPLAATEQLSYNTTNWSEGLHTLAIRAYDDAGNITNSEPWTVFVDRSAPVIPPGAVASRVDGDTDSAATIRWTGADDPDFAGGEAASGIDRYRVRWVRNGVYGAWTDVDDNRLEDAGLPAGSYALQVTAIDEVGNTSAVATIPVTPMTVTNGGLYRDAADGRVYLIEDGQRAWISSPAAADQNDLDVSTAVNVGNGALNSIPQDDDINFQELDPVDTPGPDEEEAEFQELTDGAQARATGGGLPGKTYGCTRPATIRNAPDTYAIGWCVPSTGAYSLPGWQQTRIRVTAQDKHDRRWDAGRITGAFDGCAWIRTANRVTEEEKNISPKRCRRRGPNENRFARRMADNDCIRDDCQALRKENGVVKYDLVFEDGEIGTHPTTVKDCDRWMNVNYNDSTGTKGYDKLDEQIPSGKEVLWRYVTRGRGFVMVKYEGKVKYKDKDGKDATRDSSHNWTFVAKDCAPTPPTFAKMKLVMHAEPHDLYRHDALQGKPRFRVVRPALPHLSRRKK